MLGMNDISAEVARNFVYIESRILKTTEVK